MNTTQGSHGKETPNVPNPPQNYTVEISSTGLILFTTFLIMFVTIVLFGPTLVRYWRRSRSATVHETSLTPPPQPSTEARKADRYRDIESWLINRRVLRHDELCEKVGLFKKESHRRNKLRKRTSSMETVTIDDEEEVAEVDPLDCPICLSEIEVDQIVSWSPNPSCAHFFHHHCVKEWLLSHTECPFCRECFLPIEQVTGKLPRIQISELMVAQKNRLVECFFCLEHAVVHLPCGRLEAYFTDPTEVKNLRGRAKDFPDRLELVELRAPDETNNKTDSKVLEDFGTIMRTITPSSSNLDLEQVVVSTSNGNMETVSTTPPPTRREVRRWGDYLIP